MSIAQYTGRKSLEAIAASAEGGLPKTLAPFSLIGLGIGRTRPPAYPPYARCPGRIDGRQGACAV
jgi:hypothetical protein